MGETDIYLIKLAINFPTLKKSYKGKRQLNSLVKLSNMGLMKFTKIDKDWGYNCLEYFDGYFELTEKFNLLDFNNGVYSKFLGGYDE